jgi:hypothetical protein
MTIKRMIRMLQEHDPSMGLMVEVVGHGERPAYDLHSYRGYYEQLAIGFGPFIEGRGQCYPTVGALLAALDQAIGSTYEGWKGGDFVMHDWSTLWVAQEGTTDQSGQPGEVVVRDGVVVIRVFEQD